ncbi:YicC protein [Candidatus Zixiibacteriota bacterium]|nr:YicC protein [candidate division Zixibacteria bacterium]
MNSMTGYGKADFRNRQLAVSVEVSSVNNRYLEFSFRLPKQLGFLEPRLKELVASKLSRGKVSLLFNYEDYGFGIDRLTVNRSLAESALGELQALKKKYNLKGEIEIGHLVAFPDIFRVDKSEDLEKRIWPIIEKVTKKALDGLVTMRHKEGTHLEKDFRGRLSFLTERIGKIEKDSSQNISRYREKLTRRINEVLDNRTADGARLEEEVAYFAERSDITEECVRFRSHLKQFGADLKGTDSVGKRLNFILQELNREANTIGSKSAVASISKAVLELKEEIEKMREQVQNIE